MQGPSTWSPVATHRLLDHTASNFFFHVPDSAFPMTSTAIMLKNVNSPKKGVKELIL